jgi:hypothetical protein
MSKFDGRGHGPCIFLRLSERGGGGLAVGLLRRWARGGPATQGRRLSRLLGEGWNAGMGGGV